MLRPTARSYTTPYKLFCEDLITQMQTWYQQGDRLILLMDANEHILRGTFCRRLTYPEFGLDIEEMVHVAWHTTSEPNTFADGSKPIDGVWASYSL